MSNVVSLSCSRADRCPLVRRLSSLSTTRTRQSAVRGTRTGQCAAPLRSSSSLVFLTRRHSLCLHRYPGCACDIPSINYQYTWNPSSEWSSYYSGAPEILAYFKKTAADFKLDRNVKLEHTLISARWGEDDNLWHFEFQKASGEIVTDSANLFVNATGVLKSVSIVSELDLTLREG